MAREEGEATDPREVITRGAGEEITHTNNKTQTSKTICRTPHSSTAGTSSWAAATGKAPASGYTASQKLKRSRGPTSIAMW